MIKISVIIPVYNAEKYIKEALRSLVKQTIGLDSMEIIIVNDGSTDNSLRICQKFAEKYSQVKLINQDNAGTGTARNRGMEEARGSYLAFLDPDDYLPLDAYKNMYAATEEETIDIVIGKWKLFYEDGKEEIKNFDHVFKDNTNTDEEILLDIKYNRAHMELIRYGQSWFKIFKREMLVKNNIKFTLHKQMQDIPFSTIAYFKANHIKAINKVIYFYRKHAKSTLATSYNGKEIFINRFDVLKVVYDLIRKFGLQDYKYIFDYIALSVHMPMVSAIREFYSRSAIEKYELSPQEFESISTIIREIIKNSSFELILGLDWRVRYIYVNLFKNIDTTNQWTYNRNYKHKISIIVPIYNVEKYLKSCLDSIKKQTYTNIEVIMVDDGSSDDSYKIAELFEKSDSRFKLIRQKNSGQGEARNHGLKYASGDYINFVDSDDALPLIALELLYQKAMEDDSDLVVGKAIMLHEADGRLEDIHYQLRWHKLPKNTDLKKQVGFPFGKPVVWAKLYRKSVIIDNNLTFLPIIGEDVFFSVQTCYYAHKISIINDIVYTRLWRSDEENASTMQTVSVKTVIDRLIGQKAIMDFYLEKGITEIRAEIAHVFYHINTLYLKLSEKNQAEAYIYIQQHIKNLSKEDIYFYSERMSLDYTTIQDINYKQYTNLLKRQCQPHLSMPHKISIILPIHNVEHYLEKALQSIRQQTVSQTNLEILMVDDGSSDGSSAIVDCYAKKYSNFIAIHLSAPSGTAGKPRNVGMQHATGDYIMFLDPDDYYERTAVQTLYNLIISHNADIGIGSFWVLSEDGNKYQWSSYKNITHNYIGSIDEDVLFYNLTMINSKIFKRNFIAEHNLLFDEKYVGQDINFTANALFLAKGIAYTKNSIYHYVERKGDNPSISNKLDIKFFKSVSNAYRLRYNLFTDHNKLRDYPQTYLNEFNNYCMSKLLAAVTLTKEETIEALKVLYWYFKLGQTLNIENYNLKYSHLASKVINEEYEQAYALIEYYRNENIFTPPQVIQPKYSNANAELHEIYNSRSWRVVTLYRDFATKNMIGKLARSIVLKSYRILKKLRHNSY